MKRTIQLIDYSDNRPTREDVELAPTCPICNVTLLPEVIDGVIVEDKRTNSSIVYLLNYCPHCGECFISQHSYDDFADDGYCFDSAAPQKPVPIKWDHFIQEISPNFVEIYNQSTAAESQGLDQIAGIGYRKALEFLIKDYLISKTDDPDSIFNIKNKFLGKCINEDIENPQLKTVASRAAWLGNDQTHYEQRYEDRDISDLKRMIRLTVHWISLLKETEEAESIQPH